jgi:hypothetical protein
MATVLQPERSGEELAELIDGLHHALCSSHHELLYAIGEHDRVEAWRASGARSEEDYLARRLGVAWRTAKDWVRAARVLGTDASLSEHFASGVISWDKLNGAAQLIAARRPETAEPVGPFDDPAPGGSGGSDEASDQRLGDNQPEDASEPQDDAGSQADQSDGTNYAGLAEQLTAAQLARLAARARQASAEEADRLHRRRHLTVSRCETQRRLSISVAELFDDDAATVWAAFTDYLQGCKADPVTGLFDPFPMRAADALVAMATAYLAAREKVTHHPMVMFHADARVLAGEGGWAETSDYGPLAAETIRRLACDCHLNVSADDTGGNPLKLGRKVRDATWQQIDVCRRRDGGCRLCEARLFTHAHHILWWDRDHGRTDDTNLVTLCTRCHHLVHEGGWTIDGDPYGVLRFISPKGAVVSRAVHPAHPPGRRAGTRPPGCSDAGTTPTGKRDRGQARPRAGHASTKRDGTATQRGSRGSRRSRGSGAGGTTPRSLW